MPEGTSNEWRGYLVAVAVAAAASSGALLWQRAADAPVETAPLPPPPEVLAQAPRDLGLAVSTSSTGDHAPDAATVLVGRGQLLVGGDPRPIAVYPEGLAALGATGLPERFKRNGASDFDVTELGNELVHLREQGAAPGSTPALAVLADATTPYRVLSEVLFTAASSGFERVDLAVRGRDGRLGWLASSLSPPRPFRVWKGFPPRLFATDEGLTLRWRRGKTAPGCDLRAAGAVLPKAGGAYDLGGLAACLRRLKTERPHLVDLTSLALDASPAVDWQALVTVIDTVIGTGDAGALFPDLLFTLGPSREPLPEASVYDDDRDGLPAMPASEPMRTGQGPRGTASLGGAAISGGNVANASAVVAGMAAGLRRCYNRGLEEAPKMKGSLRVTAKIGADGEVLSATPSGSGLSGIVVSCVVARVSSAQFAPPDGGRATIVIPVTFTTE
jgi:uncharacterized protein YfiM (DUF2279 family)